MQKYKLYLEIDKKFNYNIQVQNACDVVDFLCNDLKLINECEEVLELLCLDSKNNVIGVFEVARGTLNQCETSPREIFKRAITCNANSIILAHNHPSGNNEPSKQDIIMNNQIKKCSTILNINFLDHLIVSNSGYHSMND